VAQLMRDAGVNDVLHMQPIRDVHMLLSCIFCINFVSPYQARRYALSALRQARYRGWYSSIVC